jgi:starch phosphorylase
MPTDLGRVAYFSMEVAVHDSLPIFSGGLGVLAGDHLKSAADLDLPLVAVSLLYRKGYFGQTIDPSGHQLEADVSWRPEEVATRMPYDLEVEVDLRGRKVALAAWMVEIEGETGGRVPLYLLDSDLPQNHADDRDITDHLYGGDKLHRLLQESVLGIGGVRLLRDLGLDVATYHLNEGHSALLSLELLDRLGTVEAVRSRCVFTTHTPVPAGHDRFDGRMVAEVLGPERAQALTAFGVLGHGELDMTELALAASRVANAVSVRHRAVARGMHPGSRIASVTNGVHAGRWVSPPVADLLDAHVPGWRIENSLLRYTSGVPLDEIAGAHALAKGALLDEVKARSGASLDPAAFTIGIARRVTPYKRNTLLFGDPDRLRSLVRRAGPVQVVVSGKAHPRDDRGKAMIGTVLRAAAALKGQVEVVFLENYDLGLARALCAGSDLWLNMPVRPNEASGTSGMKAALNAVPSAGVLDGWWVEGCIDGVTGWAVVAEDEAGDAGALFGRLEREIVPRYYGDPAGYAAVGRSALALNGSFFNTERMVCEYVRLAYEVLTPSEP